MPEHPDAAKWNQRYLNRNTGDLPDSCQLLSSQAHLIPQHGLALDLASGLGGNSLLLADKGLTVHAWDISDVALNKLHQVADNTNRDILTEIRDLNARPPEPESFDCIVVSYYLERNLCSAISAALKPGGVLFYQTFTRNKLSSRGPSSEAFLLKNNELLSLFPYLEVRFYQENARCGDTASGDRDTAALVAQKKLAHPSIAPKLK